ncbi:MAG TPA: hypothetical protein VI094_15375 [Propionibacteriaceae bacterium]
MINLSFLEFVDVLGPRLSRPVESLRWVRLLELPDLFPVKVISTAAAASAR